MPFSYLNCLRLALLFTVVIAVSSCTGQDSKKPTDAQPILGKTEKAFYNTVTPNQILGVSVSVENKTATRFSIRSSVLSLLGNIDYSGIRLSVDGTYLTVVGENPIYEFNAANPSVAAQPGFAAPSTTIDTLCFSSAGQGSLLGSTGFSEVRTTIAAGGYSLSAAGPKGAQSLFAANPTAVRNDSGTEVTYLSSGVGLHIKKQNPSASDSTYFASFIDAQVSSLTDWASVSTLVCHLNNAPSGKLNVVTMTTDGIFIVPLGVTSLQIELWGAGGGGGGGDSSATGAGGGGGAYVKVNAFSVTANQPISYTVGVGGSGSNGSFSGGSGTDTSVVSFNFTAHGGAGGASSASQTTGTGGAGGIAIGGDTHTNGTVGQDCQYPDGGAGGACANGGIGGASSNASAGVHGSPGTDGAFPGGGGGGGGAAADAEQAGKGANGQIKFTYTSP